MFLSFFFVREDNFEKEIPYEYKGIMEIKFNINKSEKIEEYFNL